MATTPGKMNDATIDTKATQGMGDASDMGKAEDLNRNWDRDTKAAEGAGNVSSITEGRRSSEGWTQTVQQGASDLAGKVQEVASNFGSQAKDFAQDAGKKVQDFATNAADKTSGAIREYPLQSLLVGFGVGCLVGFLIPRK